jgi:hypothetical protein
MVLEEGLLVVVGAVYVVWVDEAAALFLKLAAHLMKYIINVFLNNTPADFYESLFITATTH